MFSVLDRPKALENPLNTGKPNSYVALRYMQNMELAPDWLRNLQLIEAANLADQSSLDKWPNLKRIWESA